MEIRASQRYIRQAPRKVRLVANTVKDLSLEQAIRQLAVVRRAATLPVLKTLRQAVANAQHNHGLAPADLRIKELIVNDGSILKRWRAVSRGRAHSIQKKTCHISVTLATIEKPATPATATAKKPVATAEAKQPPAKTAAKPVKAKPAPAKTTRTTAKKAAPKAAKPAAKKVSK